jgi:hypothetical protein
MSNDDIQDLILQLRRIHIQQADFLVRLERAREIEARAGIDNETKTNVDEPREFIIGDRVQIKNPNRFQADCGTITKIGDKRITVQTRSGTKILRAPKNLIFEDERE